jgi:hypothetical protein
MSIALLGLAACLDGTTEPTTSAGNGLALTILPGPGGVTALDSGRVVLQGPTNRTVTVTPGTTVTIDQLAPGTYTVSLQGFQGGGVAYFGRTAGVTVVAGQNASASVTFASFRPAILEMPAYTTDGQFVLVYSRVTNAASYVVQRAADAGFTSPTETVVAASDTSIALSIPLTGPFHMRVMAVDPLGARGLASVAQVTTTLTSVTVTPPTASIAPGATQQFTAVAKDAQNNTITGITFFWVSSNQSVALVDQTGLATGMTGGSATISALGLGVPGGSALTVSPTVPTQLAFTVQPANATARSAISPAIEVEVRDASGARVTTARNTVTLSIGTNPTGGALSGTKTVNAVNGIATFPGVSIDYAGTGYTLLATSGSLTGATSSAFDITPGLTPTGASLLANTTFVDYNTTTAGSEASNVLFGLQSFGLTVTPFVDVSTAGIIDATANTGVLVIPELETSDVTPSLSPEARKRIVNFVENGGTLIVFFPGSGLNFVNTVFGYTITVTGGAAPYGIDAAAAAGTPYAGGPASLPSLSATSTVNVATLPVGSKAVYKSGATNDAAVAVIPLNAGRIVILGWDWFNAPPKGTAAEGGWLDVLHRATQF